MLYTKLFIRPIMASLLLPILPLTAAEPAISGTGYLVDVPVPGILCTNAAGQGFLKGNVHVMRVQTSDSRATGRLQAAMDLAYLPDGTGNFGGGAYQEVGTWDLSDPRAPKFTSAGGVWEMNYRGVMQADGSCVIRLTGYGIGGAIDSLQVEETINRGPGTTFDPAVPYTGTMTILPAALTTVDVVDNYDDGVPPVGDKVGTLVETDGRLTVRGEWSSPTHQFVDSTAWISPEHTWAVQPGQTIEARVDLVSLEGPATGAALALYHAPAFCHVMLKGQDYILLGKQQTPGVAIFSADKVTTKNTNVVLVLALTPAGQNVIVTARVLDKANNNAVLYERSIVDTPAIDPSLTSAELAAVTGMTLQLQPDTTVGPWTKGRAPFIGVFQYTDGKLAAAEATFDNFVLQTYEIPQLSIERAVRVLIPAPVGQSLIIESAPTPNGPFLPVHDLTIPGLQQLTVPATPDALFYRAKWAP